MPEIGNRIRQFRQLARLFFGRFLENDLITVDGDTSATLVGVVSLLIAPGVFLPLLEYIQFSSMPLGYLPWYVRDQAALPDKVLHVALSMTALALFTVFEWDAILPDRRDLAVLSPLPVGLGAQFAARVAALAGLWVILTLAVDGVSGWFFPMSVVQSAPDGILAWHIRCHMLSLVAANLFVFLALIAIQGLLMTALGWARFRRFAPYAQFVLVIAILTLFFVSIGQAWGVNAGAPPSKLIAALPAWWFVGLDQVQLGWRRPLFDALARYVPVALALAAGLAAASYGLSYRRSVLRAFEELEAGTGQPGWVANAFTRAVNALVVRTPSQRAAFHFVWQTVTRSRTHRTLVAAWAGAGFALVFQGIAGSLAAGRGAWWTDVAGPLLPVPIVLPVFLVTGIRYAFTIPSELKANWLFQSSATDDPGSYLAGARKACLVLILLPLCSVLLPGYVLLWGWERGGVQVVIGAVSAWLLVEAQLAGLEKIPFTCSYVPGKANLKNWWTIYVAAYLVYVGVFSWLDLKILQAPGRLPWFIAGAVLVRVGIERHRRLQSAAGLPLRFDERPEPAVHTLQLQG